MSFAQEKLVLFSSRIRENYFGNIILWTDITDLQGGNKIIKYDSIKINSGF